MEAHDPYQAAKVVLFFTTIHYNPTIIHTPTSENTIGIKALRYFSHHYRSSNKLTAGHFLRAHSRGLSLQEIGSVDITSAHCGSACSPTRGEQGAERESVCVCVLEGEGVYGSSMGQGYSHAPHDLFPQKSKAYHLSTYVDLRSIYLNSMDYIRRY